MRMLLMLIIGIAVVGGILYVTLGQQNGMQAQVKGSTQSAQDAAAAYKANQEKMMKDLGQ